MDNRDKDFEKMDLDCQELENVSGGMSDSRKREIQDYVYYFRRHGHDLNETKGWWKQRAMNANISREQLDEDYKYMEQIF